MSLFPKTDNVATFKNFVESKLLENKTKLAIFDEKPYEIVTFVDDELQIDVNVDVDNDTVWLSQEQIAMLFDKAICEGAPRRACWQSEAKRL